MTAARSASRAVRVRVLVGVLAVLYAVLAGFVVVRFATDLPHLLAGSVTEQTFARRYVVHPWVPYVHILLGVVYLAGAPFQLAARFRSNNYRRHRRTGRVLAVAAVLSAGLAIWFGLVSPWGGVWEASASLTFGSWFALCIGAAVCRVRAGDAIRHRRWMIRAFAIGTATATIRLWVGGFTLLLVVELHRDVPDLPEPTTFGISFWLAFGCHALLAEWWLLTKPLPSDLT